MREVLAGVVGGCVFLLVGAAVCVQIAGQGASGAALALTAFGFTAAGGLVAMCGFVSARGRRRWT